MKAFKGQGRAMFAEYLADGVTLGPWYPFGNLVTLEITPAAEKVEVESTDWETFGQALDTITEADSPVAKISSNRFDHRTLAILWQGTSYAQAGTAGSVVDEPYVATLDGAARLAHRNVSEVVVENEAGDVTYDVDVDYTVDERGGFVVPLKSGAIADASTIHISYDFAAESGYKITGSTEPSRKIALSFDGKNAFGGGALAADIKKCTISPTSSFDFMSKEPASAEFELLPLLIPGETSSYQVYVPE